MWHIVKFVISFYGLSEVGSSIFVGRKNRRALVWSRGALPVRQIRSGNDVKPRRLNHAGDGCLGAQHTNAVRNTMQLKHPAPA